MKIDTLQFVHTVLVHHPPEVAHAHVAALLPSLLTAVSDPFYKITSEALLVLQQLVIWDKNNIKLITSKFTRFCKGASNAPIGFSHYLRFHSIHRVNLRQCSSPT